MYIMCPALAAGEQEETGIQHVCVVLAEVRSAKGDRSQRWRLVPKASPCPCMCRCGSLRARDAMLCADPLL